MFIAATLLSGCTHGQARFPSAPNRVDAGSNEDFIRHYDLDDDGSPEYAQRTTARGRILDLLYDDDQDGSADRVIHYAADRAASRPHVLIILDSIPFQLVQDHFKRGGFGLFQPPGCVIAPFPVMTDISLNELMRTSPARGVETEYFDGKRLIDGWGGYNRQENSNWLDHVHVWESFDSHASAYQFPRRSLNHELQSIACAVARSGNENLTAYVVSTSALGMIAGRDGHAEALSRLDRFCQWLMYRAEGDLDITLMSDHGHELRPSRRLPLDRLLDRLGYDLVDRINDADDVVLPRFGLVSCVAIYTRSADAVARGITGLQGVELAAYRQEEAVMVVGKSGIARIHADGDRLCYEPLTGDPLHVLSDSNPKEKNAVCLDDTQWLEQTARRVYPDPVCRLWRAFSGLIQHTPDVLVSLSPGWFWGSPFMSAFICPQAIHGSLGSDSSLGFVMSTRMQFPATLRMDTVADVLENSGVSIR